MMFVILALASFGVALSITLAFERSRQGPFDLGYFLMKVLVLWFLAAIVIGLIFAGWLWYSFRYFR